MNGWSSIRRKIKFWAKLIISLDFNQKQTNKKNQVTAILVDWPRDIRNVGIACATTNIDTKLVSLYDLSVLILLFSDTRTLTANNTNLNDMLCWTFFFHRNVKRLFECRLDEFRMINVHFIYLINSSVHTFYQSIIWFIIYFSDYYIVTITKPW